MTAPWIVTVTALWALLLLVVVVQIGVLRKVMPLLESIDEERDQRWAPGSALDQGPPLGSPLPDFAGTTMDGTAVTAGHLRGRDVILLLLSGGCPPCEALVAELQREGTRMLEAGLVIVADLGDGPRLTVPEDVDVVLQKDQQVSKVLLVSATPFALAIDASGVIRGTGFPNTMKQLQSLANGLTSSTNGRAGGGANRAKASSS